MSIRSSTQGSIYFADGLSGNEAYRGRIEYNHTNDRLQFGTSGTGSLVNIDSSGRLLTGTTTSSSAAGFDAKIQVASTSFDGSISLRRDSADTGSSALVFGKSRGSLNGNTIVQSGDRLGSIEFYGADGTDVSTGAAQIQAAVDGTPGSNDMPGRLVFSTTADGASSSTERLRITSAGKVLAGNYFTSQQIGSFESALQIQGTTGDTSSMSIFRYSADAGGPNITLGKGRGSAGGVDKPNDNDAIGAIRFQIANNNNLTDGESAKIECNVDATPGGGDYPSRLTFYTAADGANSITERLRITSAGNVGINETTPQQQLHVHDDTAYNGIFINGNGAPRVTFARDTTTTVEWGVGIDGTDGTKFAIAQAGNTAKLLLTTGGNLSATGTISDSKGELRKLIRNTQAGTYTLVASDHGKYVWASNTVTIPNNVFSHGDMVTIVNDTNGNLTLTKDIATMYMSSDGTSANRTLSAYGMATILFVSGTTAYISGAGLS
jgi:hypothetical protein